MSEPAMPAQARSPMESSETPAATSWAEVIRLRTLPAAVAPVLLGAGAATYLGAFSLPRTLLAACVALALQIGSNLANDYSDGIRGTDDDRTGPPRLTASGLVDPSHVKYAAFACFEIAALAGLILVILSGQWWLLGVGLAAVAAAWFYTGGDHPYGYAGLGEVFVFLFFGLVATCGTVYIQAGHVPGWVWLAATGIGLIACSLLMVNNLRDIDTDPAHGKQTLAVRLGEGPARFVFALMVMLPWPIGGASLLLAAPHIHPGLIAAVGVALFTTAWWVLLPVIRDARGRALIPVLRNAGLYELLYAVLLAGLLAALAA